MGYNTQLDDSESHGNTDQERLPDAIAALKRLCHTNLSYTSVHDAGVMKVVPVYKTGRNPGAQINETVLKGNMQTSW